ncbi:MAG TPA: AAA family ATPase [Candidatus Eremiobacteraeota bacterium]|nr:MAG: ATP-dependent Clp protease ATP-binding subunit ClpX [bacterium ADurb.Bin363]HPZ06908.1 AAA family ATPase [Candidatus Eremiobacteraeota bacterium]
MSKFPGTDEQVCSFCHEYTASSSEIKLIACDRCEEALRGITKVGGTKHKSVKIITEPKVVKKVASLPLISPRKIFELLEKQGYRGQDVARKAVSLMAYRHIKRLKRIYMHKMDRKALSSKFNYLFIGPTGCGKTYMVELLFNKILRLPNIIVDITTFSETGYIGEDVTTILTRLINAADGDHQWASCGIVCIDEFDKLATSRSNARFSGEGTTKDVSGLGVQRELLKMLESTEILVPLDYGYSAYGEKVALPTVDISFLACGAFSGFKELSFLKSDTSKMGLIKAPKPGFKEKIAVMFEETEIENIEVFQSYGFLPELLGRFTRFIPFEPLDEKTLKSILQDNVISKFQEEFFDEGFELIIKDDVIDYIVSKSIKRQTGARGLNSILTKCLEEIAYDNFFSGKQGKIYVRIEDDKLVTKIKA